MTTPWTHILKKVDDYRWEIPTSYKAGMRVPGLVFADERMLRQIAEEQALEQVANAATLPGIVGRALAMPDIHWGYGFPVGGVAAFRVDDGIISPGAIGYDINCLAGDARVLHAFGFHRPIAEFLHRWADERIRCIDPSAGVRDTAIAAFLAQPLPAAQPYRVTTESGREIVATADHPFLTPQGMRPLRDVPVGEVVAVHPFEGVPFVEPGSDVLVTEDDLRRTYPGGGHGCDQIIAALQARGLLPLRLDHPRLPHLIKLLGFVDGDGSLQPSLNGRAALALSGQPSDLEEIRKDVLAVGFRPSRVRSRERPPQAPTAGAHAVTIRSSALAWLLCALGATAGHRAQQDGSPPGWLDRAPLWMKRLYLAALFGAGLSAPQTVPGHPAAFCEPVLSMPGRARPGASGRRYLQKIQEWLAEFGVESRLLTEREEGAGAEQAVAGRLRLQISSQPENLLRLWTKIGFEYHRRKQHLACVAAQYLRLKSLVVAERQLAVEVSRVLRQAGRNLDEIAARHSRHSTRALPAPSTRPSPSARWGTATALPDFPTFVQERTAGLGETARVWDVVIRKAPCDHRQPVYDFTVADPSHTFVANTFVVSNCGVRLIRTDLDEQAVREKLSPLVDALFAAVPSGVGSTGRVKVTMQEIDVVLRDGARWAVGRGYGWPEDLDVIEAGGALEQADPDAVSPQAKQRGRGQIGTLGSGNHFLEIQVVDQIYDRRAAHAMGLDHPGQVVVFVHCGSRGLGHQVCTDYLRVSERSARAHGIHLVDRQLACMPFASPEGRRYFGAMSAAANFAWANRQMITHWVREAFSQVFATSPQALGMTLVYDVAHNIGKVEEYEVDGRGQRVVVHRKGATRAFPPGHPEIPAKYREVGQPVLIPGDMGRYSFVAVGTEGAMRESFGSTCHGAGRVMGRKQATRALAGVDIAGELRAQGILVRAQDRSLLAEEASAAYKDVADVVAVCDAAGISRRVARTRPIGVVKG